MKLAYIFALLCVSAALHFSQTMAQSIPEKQISQSGMRATQQAGSSLRPNSVASKALNGVFAPDTTAEAYDVCAITGAVLDPWW